MVEAVPSRRARTDPHSLRPLVGPLSETKNQSVIIRPKNSAVFVSQLTAFFRDTIGTVHVHGASELL